MITLIKALGWFFAKAPQFIPQLLIKACLGIFFATKPNKLWLAESNLHHAFPNKDLKWISRNARKSLIQLAETSLFSLITPFINRNNLNRYLSISPKSLDEFNKALESGRPLILACPHMGCWEAITLLPALVDGQGRKFSSLYRPLKNPKLDAWVKESRERFGFEMLSRRQGLSTVLKTLRGKGIVGVLFDQHTSKQGALISFIDRYSSATPLPGILASKFDCGIITMVADRTKFWHYETHIEFHEIKPKENDATVFVNQWLENRLLSSPDKAYTWLWAHRRWKVQLEEREHFNIETKASLISHYKNEVKKYRILVILPQSETDVKSALNLLPKIQYSRPDAEITILTKKQYTAFSALPSSTTILSVESNGGDYSLLSAKVRGAYYDSILKLNESPYWDRLLKNSGCRFIFGINRPNVPNHKLIRYAWKSPNAIAPKDRYQEWMELLKHFGLQEENEPATDSSQSNR
tara:strand:- start:3906 stop:5306 length:1401 start_codon:yes stop_codon:yes gene_type:complete